MAYKVNCDGFPLLDPRHEDYILVSPCVKLEVNTVGEGSFTIYKNHPHYDKLKKLKSVFEISDETSVIFRGRATGDTIDFDHGMAVDLEGAMAYFNDSIVRPFFFPEDFEEDADYIAAAESGNVIEFFLGWLIDNHNAQVEDFQKMKLGNVTVSDPNNYITRSNSDYASTWATLKDKLFDSSFGGYLCIRYEADGNYIDYLAEFTETNGQEIAFGENILDLKKATEASGTYSAIIPIGALGLTIEGVEDGDITEDLVKSGDTIYSKSAVAECGWIYAPTSETTWDDVTEERNLLKKGGEWLLNGGMLLSHGVEVTAVDLHFSDAQIESMRIYKKINVRSASHSLVEQFPLTCLEIELLEPQNTKITIGKTIVSLSERTIKQEEEVRKKYSKLSKNDEEIKMEVVDLLAGAESRWTASVDGFSQTVQGYAKTVEGYDQAVDDYGDAVENYGKQVSSFEQTARGFTLSVENLDKKINNSLTLDENGLVVTGNGGSVTINGGQIDASTINAGDLVLTGTLSWSDFSDETKASSLVLDANGLVSTGDGKSVTISGGQIDASTINAEQLDASKINAGDLKLSGVLAWGDFSDTEKEIVLEETTQAAKNDINQTVVPGLEDRIQASKDRADDAYDMAEGAGITADNANLTATNAQITANTAKEIAEETSDEFASVKKTSGGKTYIDGSKIYSSSIYADALHLGGSMTVYSSETGTTVGGYLGYTTSANDGSAGMHMMKGNGEVVVTTNGAKLTYGGTTNQVYVSSSAAAMVAGSGSVYVNSSQVRLNNGSCSLYLADAAFYPTTSGGVTLGTSSYKWGQGYSTASTFSTSDRNEKNSIEDLPVKYLNLFDHLRPVRFKFNDGTSDRFHVGFIAQDVEDSMAAVEIDSQEFGGFGKDTHEETGEDIYMLRYEEFVGILAAKLQDVDKRLKLLEETA